MTRARMNQLKLETAAGRCPKKLGRTSSVLFCVTTYCYFVKTEIIRSLLLLMKRQDGLFSTSGHERIILFCVSLNYIAFSNYFISSSFSPSRIIRLCVEQADTGRPIAP